MASGEERPERAKRRVEVGVVFRVAEADQGVVADEVDVHGVGGVEGGCGF